MANKIPSDKLYNPYEEQKEAPPSATLRGSNRNRTVQREPGVSSSYSSSSSASASIPRSELVLSSTTGETSEDFLTNIPPQAKNYSLNGETVQLLGYRDRIDQNQGKKQIEEANLARLLKMCKSLPKGNNQESLLAVGAHFDELELTWRLLEKLRPNILDLETMKNRIEVKFRYAQALAFRQNLTPSLQILNNILADLERLEYENMMDPSVWELNFAPHWKVVIALRAFVISRPNSSLQNTEIPVVSPRMQMQFYIDSGFDFSLLNEDNFSAYNFKQALDLKVKCGIPIDGETLDCIFKYFPAFDGSIQETFAPHLEDLLVYNKQLGDHYFHEKNYKMAVPTYEKILNILVKLGARDEVFASEIEEVKLNLFRSGVELSFQLESQNERAAARNMIFGTINFRNNNGLEVDSEEDERALELYVKLSEPTAMNIKPEIFPIPEEGDSH